MIYFWVIGSIIYIILILALIIQVVKTHRMVKRERQEVEYWENQLKILKQISVNYFHPDLFYQELYLKTKDISMDDLEIINNFRIKHGKNWIQKILEIK